jgi:hypothetical protein
VYRKATNRLFTVFPLLSLFLDTHQGHHGGALIKCRPQRNDFEEDEEKKKKMIMMMMMSGTWMVKNNEGNISHRKYGNCVMEKRQTTEFRY